MLRSSTGESSFVGEKYRTVIRDHRFEQELAALVPNAALADQAICGLEIVLSRTPRRGVPIGPEPLWATPVYTLGPDLLVYYEFDDDTVTLLSVIEADV